LGEYNENKSINEYCISKKRVNYQRTLIFGEVYRAIDKLNWHTPHAWRQGILALKRWLEMLYQRLSIIYYLNG